MNSRMSFLRVLLCGVGVVLVAGCGVEGPGDDAGTWVGEVRTQGAVTTVINQSGSVWGGVATLVEEVSLGVEKGYSAATFSVPFAPRGVWALAPDGRLMRADSSEYRVTIEMPRGETLVVVRQAALVPVEPEGTAASSTRFSAPDGAPWKAPFPRLRTPSLRCRGSFPRMMVPSG